MGSEVCNVEPSIVVYLFREVDMVVPVVTRDGGAGVLVKYPLQRGSENSSKTAAIIFRLVSGGGEGARIPGVKGPGGEAGGWWRGLDGDGNEEEKENLGGKRSESSGGIQRRFLQNQKPAKPASDTADGFEVRRFR